MGFLMVASGGPVNCVFILLTAGTEARRKVVVVPGFCPTTALPLIEFGVTALLPGVPGVCGGPTRNNWKCPFSVLTIRCPCAPDCKPCSVIY